MRAPVVSTGRPSQRDRRSRGSQTCINLRSHRRVLQNPAPFVNPWQTPAMPPPSANAVPGFLSVTDLGPGAIGAVLDAAAAFRDGRVAPDAARPLAGAHVAVLLAKPSLRTRVSFEVGIARLGGQAVVLTGNEIGIGSREEPGDIGRVLGRYVDAIVARVFAHSVLGALADGSGVPVINALSDAEHPCQALADLFVLRDHLGPLAGRRLVYLGDGNNVAASLLLACASVGMHIRVVTPPGYAPDPAIVARAQTLAAAHGSEVEVRTEPAGAAAGADAVYTDVWASMGQEAEADARRPVFAPYRVTAALLADAPEARVLHCLPAHRGEEIEAAVLDGPRSIVFDQAEARLWVQMALLARLVRPRRPG